MTVFRVRFEVAGGHVHCALFAAKGQDFTFSKCGDFTIRRGDEFSDLMAALKAEYLPFIGSEDDSTIEKAVTA